MRAILIDSENQTIREVDYNGDYRHIRNLIGCHTFTVLIVQEEEDGSNEAIFVDDEGLLGDPTYFFVWGDHPEPLANKGLILGCDAEGESVGTDLRIEYVKSMVRFLQLSKSTPVFGPPKQKRNKS